MKEPVRKCDAIVIGGGFYGAVIAAYLRDRGLREVVLIEREARLLRRASTNNQARVHNGYHYPRSFMTAYRSRVNLPRFVREWGPAVEKDFTMVYAVARSNSKVTARQFERFCNEIGATLLRADPGVRALFDPRWIEDVYVVEEYAFNAEVMAGLAEERLRRAGVEVMRSSRAEAVCAEGDGMLAVSVRGEDGARRLVARYVFNCTYSGLNQLWGDFPGTETLLKHEIAEMALVEMPPPLDRMGITVMDGPFFSIVPFCSRGLHTLSHVRFTPHLQWDDSPAVDPYAKLAAYHRESRVDRMFRDVVRYLPAITAARYVESLFEVKTVLRRNESDDGRPILFERHAALPGCYSILGSKIDNIYDVLERLDKEV